MRLFIDESGWVAIVTEPDSPMRNFFEEALNNGYKLYSSNIAVGNAAAKIKEKIGPAAALEFLKTIEDAYITLNLRVLWIGRRTQRDALRLFEKYRDVPLAYFDFAHIILMQRRNISSILSTNPEKEKLGISTLP